MFKIGDRVIIEGSEFNVLSDCIVKEILPQTVVCEINYGLITTTKEIPQWQAVIHPIQLPSFVYEINFHGNKEIPESNRFDKYAGIFRSYVNQIMFVKTFIKEV